MNRAAHGEPLAYFERAILIDSDDCMLWPYATSGKGYGTLWNPVEGRRGRGVHKVACERAHGPRPTTAHQAAHSCHTPSCFNPRHLSWKTPIENAADRLVDGTDNRGEKHQSVRLSESEVRSARERIAAGEQHKVIAADLGVHRTTITMIGLGKRWGWLA